MVYLIIGCCVVHALFIFGLLKGCAAAEERYNELHYLKDINECKLG